LGLQMMLNDLREASVASSRSWRRRIEMQQIMNLIRRQAVTISTTRRGQDHRQA
jgi:hypothetical protein